MAMSERVLSFVPPVTDGWPRERAMLFNLIRNEGGKVGEVARAVGKSHSAISQYISGKYASPEKLDPLVKDYLISIGRWQESDEETNVDTSMRETVFIKEITGIGLVETRDLLRVWGICRLCFEKREMGMIVGKPGTGKTFAFDHFTDFAGGDIPHIVVTCDETTSKKSLLVDVAEALSLVPRGAAPTLLKRIVNYLRNNPCLLIFDEADLLRGPKVFETIRAIYDKAETCGVVLCGNNNLAERILVYAEDRPELARLRDRIGYFQALSGLSADEADRFLQEVNCTAEARNLLRDIAMNRGTRQLMKALGRLLDETEGSRIDADLVQELGQIVLSFNA